MSITSNSDGKRLAAVVYDGNIWTSSDFGASWTETIPGGISNQEWASIASSEDGKTLAAASEGDVNGKIYSSSDYGETWEDITPNTPWDGGFQSIASSSDGARLAAVEFSGGIWTLAR